MFVRKAFLIQGLLLAVALQSSLASECSTASMKDKWIEGGWKGSFGKRLWDSKVAATTLAAVASVFFPVIAPEVVNALQEEMTGQIEGLSHAIQSLSEQARQQVTDALTDFMRTGKLDLKRFDTFDMKAALKHVDCWNSFNKPCPTLRKPGRTCNGKVDSEGYWQVYLAVRIR